MDELYAQSNIRILARDKLLQVQEELLGIEEPSREAFSSLRRFITESEVFKLMPIGLCRHCAFNTLWEIILPLVMVNDDYGLFNVWEFMQQFSTPEMLLSWLITNGVEIVDEGLSGHLMSVHNYDVLFFDAALAGITNRVAYNSYWNTNIGKGIFGYNTEGNGSITTNTRIGAILKAELLTAEQIAQLDEVGLEEYYRQSLSVLGHAGMKERYQAWEKYVNEELNYLTHLQASAIVKERTGHEITRLQLRYYALVAAKLQLAEIFYSSDSAITLIEHETGNYWMYPLVTDPEQLVSKAAQKHYIYHPQFCEFIVSHISARDEYMRLNEKKPLSERKPLAPQPGYVELGIYLQQLRAQNPALDHVNVNQIYVLISEKFIKSYRQGGRRFVDVNDIELATRNVVARANAEKQGMIQVAQLQHHLARNGIYVENTTLERHIDKGYLPGVVANPLEINGRRLRGGRFAKPEDALQLYWREPDEYMLQDVLHLLPKESTIIELFARLTKSLNSGRVDGGRKIVDRWCVHKDIIIQQTQDFLRRKFPQIDLNVIFAQLDEQRAELAQSAMQADNSQ